MADPAPKKKATYQDVLDAPEHKVAEIIDGDLYLSPRPAMPHSLAALAIGGELYPPFHRGRGGPGGWLILFEPELHIDENVVVPDIAGWRRDRLPSVPDVAYLTLAPDWICEVLSRSTERIDRSKKLRIYARAGVSHAWLVDPLKKSLEIFRLRDGMWVVVAVHFGDERVRAEPFDAIELDLAALWADVSPPTKASEAAAAYDY